MSEIIMTKSEQMYALSDLYIIRSLISFHQCKEVEGEAMGFDFFVHRARIEHLKEIGREVYRHNPDIWSEFKKEFGAPQ